jgi:hypothetical protein
MRIQDATFIATISNEGLGLNSKLSALRKQYSSMEGELILLC